MELANRLIACKSWRRYNLRDLEIAPSVVGQSHKFIHANRPVEVRLPEKPRRHKGQLRNDRISCTAFKLYGTRKKPLYYEVYSVDLLTELPKPRAVPEEAIGRVDATLLTKRLRLTLKRASNASADLSDQALEYWLRVMRWVTHNSRIGQPMTVGLESGWSTYLLESISEKAFYAPGHVMNVPASHPVSMREWNKAQEILSSSLYPPLWIEYLFEAEHRLRSNDLQGAVISLAISTESLVRALFSLHAKKPANSEFLKLIDRLSIGAIIDSWGRLGFKSPSWKAAFDRRQLKALFAVRNQIMHRATQSVTWISQNAGATRRQFGYLSLTGTIILGAGLRQAHASPTTGADLCSTPDTD